MLILKGMNRRQFAKNTLTASAAISTFSIPGFSNTMTPAKRSLKKGIMWGSIGVGKTIIEKFQAAKLAGFDGVEPGRLIGWRPWMLSLFIDTYALCFM